MYFKKMIGERCYLSPVDLEDSATYAAWVADLRIALGLGAEGSVMNEPRERKFLEEMGEFCFAIVDGKTNELLGNCSIFAVDWPNRRGKVGLFIGEEKNRGQGLGAEVLHLLLDFAFHALNLNSISLAVFSYNQRALRCYEKVGFKEIGRFREAKIVGDEKYDEIVMDFLLSEFKGSQFPSALESFQR